MPPPPLRIAILEADTPLPEALAKYGGYGGVFKQLLRAGADALRYTGLSASEGLDISVFDVVTKQEYPNLEDIDAILITGSKHDAFADIEWINKLTAFTKSILDQDRIRAIGVCFGHQIIGRALGVKVGRGPNGWECSVTAVDLTKRGQEIFGSTALAIHQMHKDIVFEYPKGVENLAYTSKCDVHAMYVPRRLITIQGHPEFTGDIMREILTTRHKLGVFDKETYDEMMGRVDKYQDGVVVSQAFLRFLLEE